MIPVARPVFNALDCRAGNYFSYIVTGDDGPDNPVVGVNSPSSYSGYTSLFTWMEKRGIRPASVTLTHSHEASLQALRDGVIHLAAIDANSWTLLDQSGVRIIGRGEEMASPPFVQSKHSPVAPDVMFEALSSTLKKMSVVGIGGVMSTSKDDYTEMADRNRKPSAYEGMSGVPIAPER